MVSLFEHSVFVPLISFAFRSFESFSFVWWVKAFPSIYQFESSCSAQLLAAAAAKDFHFARLLIPFQGEGSTSKEEKPFHVTFVVVQFV